MTVASRARRDVAVGDVVVGRRWGLDPLDDGGRGEHQGFADTGLERRDERPARPPFVEFETAATGEADAMLGDLGGAGEQGPIEARPRGAGRDHDRRASGGGRRCRCRAAAR